MSSRLNSCGEPAPLPSSWDVAGVESEIRSRRAPLVDSKKFERAFTQIKLCLESEGDYGCLKT